MKLPAELSAEAVTVIIDTREQTPFDLAPMRCEVSSLATGDYSIRGLEHRIALERKSLPDFVACCGTERERFARELQRLLAYETRAIVCEFSWTDLTAGGWRSLVTPQAASASALAWIASGVPIVFCDGRLAAQEATRRLLLLAARKRWREIRALLANHEPSGVGA